MNRISVSTPSSLEFGTLDDTALIDIRTAGSVLHASRGKIDRLFNDGRLTRIRIGGSVRIKVSELRALMAGSK